LPVREKPRCYRSLPSYRESELHLQIEFTINVNDTKVQKHHCSQCGTPFWFSADEYPGIVALKPGTFEDTSWFKPVAHLWVRSMQPWVTLSSSTPQYEKQPEISELIDLWASRENA